MRLCLALLAAVISASAADLTVPAEKLHDKIRGGLLGQILGDLNGLKHEMKYINEPGNVAEYTPSLPEGAWTDDDTDIEWVYLLEMERSGRVLLPYSRIAELWKKHINRRIWCSHLYVRRLLDLGIEPPLTGRARLNPWADFNLSGQFASESWGLISPGMPRVAARIGLHYTHVSIEGEPAQATQMFTAMIATAFLTDDIAKIIAAGRAAVDPGSEMRRIADDVVEWHGRNPSDWRATRRLIQQRYSLYGGQDMRDRNGVKLNGAATIAALLYGKGDFVETLRHAFNFGWDADNNAATSGTIIGVIRGARWILGQGWNIQDRFRNTSRDAMPDDETITRFGDRLVALAGRVIAENGGARRGDAYRIRVEEAANVEQVAKAPLNVAIELAKDPSARSAYLAIFLDRAASLREKYPEQWTKAVEALNRESRFLQVLFFDSPIPAAEAIREKALAAGVRKPERRSE